VPGRVIELMSFDSPCQNRISLSLYPNYSEMQDSEFRQETQSKAQLAVNGWPFTRVVTRHRLSD